MNIKEYLDILKDLWTPTNASKIRMSISNALEMMGNNLKENIDRQDNVENQFQDVLDETTGKDVINGPEIIAARNGEANLKARLDKEKNEVTAQWAQTNDKLNSIFSNVKDYKCDDGEYVKGDGIHDDTTGIQKALDDPKNKGGTVFLPLGVYKTTKTLKIKESVRIIGSKGRWQWKSSEINFFGTGAALEVFAHDSSGNPAAFWGFYMENLTVRQDFDLTLGHGTENVGISVLKISELYFKDVQIGGFLIGLELGNASIGTLDNCYFYHCTYGAWLASLDITKTLSRGVNNMLTFNSSNFWANKEAHVMMNDCENIFFNDTHMERSAIGFLIDGEYAHGESASVRGFHINALNLIGYQEHMSRYTQPRFIKVTSNSNKRMSVTSSSIRNAKVVFEKSKLVNAVDLLPDYAIEVVNVSNQSQVNLILETLSVWGVTKAMTYAASGTVFSPWFSYHILARENSDGSGNNVPLVDGGSQARGFISNRNSIESLGTLKLGKETTGNPTEGDIYYDYNNHTVRVNNGTSNVPINSMKYGTTAERPTMYLHAGFSFLRYNNQKPIYWDNARWLDSEGNPV